MEQLILHLVGDYVLQTDKQAALKTKSWFQATMHALTYTLVFLFLTRNPITLAIIFGTHLLIDHYRLAKYVIQFKNAIGDFPKVDFVRYNTPTGYASETPPFMAVWLFIVADNIAHLLINYVALRFFH